MFYFGDVVSANSDEEGCRCLVEEDFLNETHGNEKKIDNIIKLWIRHDPDWKTLYPEELGHETVVVVNDLDRVDLKMFMEDIGETPQLWVASIHDEIMKGKTWCSKC